MLLINYSKINCGFDAHASYLLRFALDSGKNMAANVVVRSDGNVRCDLCSLFLIFMD